MTKIASSVLVCLIALSAAGCAVEVPMDAFRMAPPDKAGTLDPLKPGYAAPKISAGR
jgi:hypothetical protein